MELASKYAPNEVEARWYQYWLDNKLFSSKPDGREPYTIVIPPPNVTGVLHMGHMLNNTIQDILIRKARLDGKNACWVPGTDHASIATEAKVVNKLAQQGIKLLVRSSSSMPGHGQKNTEASSLSSFASLVLLVTGIVQHSLWTSLVQSLCSRCSLTSTRRAISIVASVW